MGEIDVPGSSFPPREENDVHRASSGNTSLGIPVADGVVLGGVPSNFKALHMAGILVVRSLEQFSKRNR
jgi:hypothetical protein